MIINQKSIVDFLLHNCMIYKNTFIYFNNHYDLKAQKSLDKNIVDSFSILKNA